MVNTSPSSLNKGQRGVAVFLCAWAVRLLAGPYVGISISSSAIEVSLGQQAATILIMRPPPKKQKLAVMETDLTEASVADLLSIDVLANIFGYLDGPKDIMRQRRVCKKWKEAVKMTIVPPIEFRVNSVENYNAMTVMTRALPNLQQIAIGRLGERHKYNDGEDPNERVAEYYADWTPLDIEIISNLSKLRILDIESYSSLNGRYPFLFNSFPLLQKLTIKYCYHLKLDLGMLAG
jgi:hypothetical protein